MTLHHHLNLIARTEGPLDSYSIHYIASHCLYIPFYHFSKTAYIRDSFAAMSAYPEYALDIAIAEFFSQTSATREVCDTKAKDLVGGKVVPVTVQGNCSYSVYAGFECEIRCPVPSQISDA